MIIPTIVFEENTLPESVVGGEEVIK